MLDMSMVEVERNVLKPGGEHEQNLGFSNEFSYEPMLLYHNLLKSAVNHENSHSGLLFFYSDIQQIISRKEELEQNQLVCSQRP